MKVHLGCTPTVWIMSLLYDDLWLIYWVTFPFDFLSSPLFLLHLLNACSFNLLFKSCPLKYSDQNLSAVYVRQAKCDREKPDSQLNQYKYRKQEFDSWPMEENNDS